MSVQSLKYKPHALAAAMFAAIAFQPIDARAAGPFAGLAGNWIGSGTISMKNGTNERIRCRATYSHRSGREILSTKPTLRERQL